MKKTQKTNVMPYDIFQKQKERTFYASMLKNVKLLEKLGIEWTPREWAWTSGKSTYDISVTLPKHNVMIEIRLKLIMPTGKHPLKPIFGNALNRICKLQNGEITETEYFNSMQMLFEVLQARHERGDALVQNEEYRKEHGENMKYLKDYHVWKMRHAVK